jgi:hypothetical protein
MMIFLGLFLYMYYYWNNEDPPLYDIISPLTTLSLLPYVNHDMVICLLVESMADYYMDKSYLQFPILLFSLSHVIKQLIFFQMTSISLISLNLSLICLLLMVMTDDVIDLYIIILVTTFITVSYAKKAVYIAMLIFILSDIIIGIDLKYKLYPRQLRVIFVPLLYWISQSYYI